MKYPYSGGTVLVTFDPAKSTRAELDRWMRLSPELSADNGLFVPVDLRRCLPDDKRYVNCQNAEIVDLNNVEVNVLEIERLKATVDPSKYPDGLKSVAAYLAEIQTFALWRERRQRDALARHDIAPLKDVYDDLASNKVCNALLQPSPISREKKRFTNLVLVDWGNCVWKLEADKVGPYPKTQWDTFLTSHGITEKVVEEVPED